MQKSIFDVQVSRKKEAKMKKAQTCSIPICVIFSVFDVGCRSHQNLLNHSFLFSFFFSFYKNDMRQ